MAGLFYMYQPPPYNTTFVDNTFPTHHHPFEHTRHKVGHAVNEFLNPFADQRPFSPAADVRETAKSFHIDVELPGLGPTDQLRVKWINSLTLLVEATTKRPDIDIPADEQAVAAPVEGSTIKEGEGMDVKKEENPEDSVHMLTHGRHIGHYARSFYFCVEVDQKSMRAKLSNGLLSISVQKRPHEHKEAKTVEVEHVSS